RFQAACPASQSPGFKPTRGSGFGGAAVPVAGAGEAVPPLPPLEDAHDASAMMPSKRTSEAADEAAVAMKDSGLMGKATGSITRRSLRTGGFTGHRGEHALHPGHFRRLIDIHVGSKLEDDTFLCGAGSIKELMHHGEGAGVVLNHELEKETIELGAASR